MIRVKVARCDCCDCEWPIEDYRGDHPWRRWGARCDCGWEDLDLDTQPDALHEADRHLDDAHRAGPKFRRWLADLLDEVDRARESRSDVPTSTDTPDGPASVTEPHTTAQQADYVRRAYSTAHWPTPEEARRNLAGSHGPKLVRFGLTRSMDTRDQ